MQSGAPDLALRVTELMLQKDPANAAALAAKGDALYAMGQSAPASRAYRAAIALNPNLPNAQLGLGRTLIRSDPRAAEAAFLAATTLQPGNAAAQNNLGITRDMLGLHAEAQAAYRRALAAAPEMNEAEVNLGLSLAISGNTQEAVRLLRPLSADRDAPQLWRNDAAVAMTLAGDRPGARRVLQNAPDLPDALLASVRRPPPETATLAIQTAPRLPVQSAPVDDAPPLETTSAPPTALPTPSAAIASPLRIAPAETAPARLRPTPFAQLAAAGSERAAHAEWKRLKSRLPGLLANRTAAVTPAELRGQMFWRLRTGGFASPGEATRFCDRVHSAGAGCWAVAG